MLGAPKTIEQEIEDARNKLKVFVFFEGGVAVLHFVLYILYFHFEKEIEDLCINKLEAFLF